jgi:hypothetical protein
MTFRDNEGKTGSKTCFHVLTLTGLGSRAQQMIATDAERVAMHLNLIQHTHFKDQQHETATKYLILHVAAQQ